MEGFRVLFIDDEEELVSALSERLGYRGIEAEYAVNGTAGLQKMREASFDIVVLDLKLPGMSGVDVLHAINKDFPNVPVLMITGHGSPDDEESKRPEGAYDFLPKPIKIEFLVEKMQEALDSV